VFESHYTSHRYGDDTAWFVNDVTLGFTSCQMKIGKKKWKGYHCRAVVNDAFRFQGKQMAR